MGTKPGTYQSDDCADKVSDEAWRFVGAVRGRPCSRVNQADVQDTDDVAGILEAPYVDEPRE